MGSLRHRPQAISRASCAAWPSSRPATTSSRSFSWKFTWTDLSDLMHQIDARINTQPQALRRDPQPDELTTETA